MPIATFPIGPLETNCYVMHTAASALVIDPGGDASPVLHYLREQRLELAAICLTHLHFDHLYGVAGLHQATKAPVFAPMGDNDLLESEVGGGGVWGFPKVETFPWTDLNPGEHSFADMTCTVFHTPGHTAGSVSLYFPKEHAVFTGDLLFYRAVGRTDLPGGDQEQLLSSIRRKIFTLPGDTKVFPGHGPASTVDDEKTNNPYCGSFVR